MTTDDDTADICPCSDSEAAAALALIVARVMATDTDPCCIAIVKRELGDTTTWHVERFEPKKGDGN